MADLQAASGVYAAESKTLAGAVPQNGPGAADGGDGTVNEAMRNALKAAGLVTHQLADVIDTHAGRLHSMYERYHGTEESLSKLIGQLTNGLNDGGGK
jgi:hypothetical protein